MLDLPPANLPAREAHKKPSVLRYSWLVVLFAALGFTTSLAIHITAYFQYIDLDMFLFYCRAEWVGVALVALLLGILMPSPRPRRQAGLLARWMLLACSVMVCYLLAGIVFYVRSEHPRKRDRDYIVVRGRQIVREISKTEYRRLATAEHRAYTMYINRAFSLLWVILFFGTFTYGIGYLRALRRDGASDLSPEKYVPWWYGSL